MKTLKITALLIYFFLTSNITASEKENTLSDDIKSQYTPPLKPNRVIKDFFYIKVWIPPDLEKLVEYQGLGFDNKRSENVHAYNFSANKNKQILSIAKLDNKKTNWDEEGFKYFLAPAIPKMPSKTDQYIVFLPIKDGYELNTGQEKYCLFDHSAINNQETVENSSTKEHVNINCRYLVMKWKGIYEKNIEFRGEYLYADYYGNKRVLGFIGEVIPKTNQ
ncbi:MAG: hypothetical protein PVG66_13660 [Chromatiales bacterium]|jgi:hypothetical protein